MISLVRLEYSSPVILRAVNSVNTATKFVRAFGPNDDLLGELRYEKHEIEGKNR